MARYKIITFSQDGEQEAVWLINGEEAAFDAYTKLESVCEMTDRTLDMFNRENGKLVATNYQEEDIEE